MKNCKVLVLSKDPLLSRVLIDTLSREFLVESAKTPEVLSFLVKEWEPQVVVFDIKEVGVSALQSFCRSHPEIGVVCFDHAYSMTDEEEAFKVGASFYLTKDQPLSSLQVRVRKLGNIRGAGESAMPSVYEAAVIEFLGLHVYPMDFVVKSNNEVIATTPTQFKLLLAFINHREQLLSRDWLKENVWSNAPISHRSIDAQISKLKKTIPQLNDCIVNVYGKGYLLNHKKLAA